MSEKSDQEQDQKPDQNPADAQAEEAALADVDSLIAEEDPEFFKTLENIKIENASIGALDDSLGLDSQGAGFFGYLKQAIDFKNNLRSVLIFWSVTLIMTAILVFVWLNKKSFMSQNLFLTSFEKIGGPVSDFNPNNETEAFYDNPRFSKNLVTMSPVFVNLRASESSGSNPMLIFEVTIEGLSADAIIEIKDRQTEFKDMVARLTEEKTYDFVITAEGKRQLCDEIKDLLNEHLTRGQVRRVMLKNFISNPNN